jgi:hypothetical protein
VPTVMLSGEETTSSIEPEDIRDQLARMLDNEIFSRSELLSRFLEVVIREALAGNAPKASFLLEEVFRGRERTSEGQKPSKKGSDDETKVRVEAIRLRQKLLEYYAGPGADDRILIEIPKGGYSPIFRLRSPHAAPATDPEAVARLRMIQRVRNDWIGGVLKHSLYNRARIDLRLNFEPKAVANPRLMLHRLEEEPEELPPGTRLRPVFDGSAGGLLILGDPGAGKTTLLLELARDLLDRAERERDFPIPVIFNLSSWKLQKDGLESWLVKQLNDAYEVPRHTADEWIKRDQILPLLDGLDEVPADRRRECLEAINSFRGRHGLVPLVIASRSTDYDALHVRLRLPAAVVIQPLMDEDVRRFLSEPIPVFKRLLRIVESDAQLAEVLRSPLMLSIAILVYQAEDVPQADAAQSTEERRTLLLSRYVELMLHKRREHRYTAERTRKWLVWLARELQERSEAVFYLESLGPKWMGQPARALIPVLTVLGASVLAFSLFCLLLFIVYCLIALRSARLAELPLIAMKWGVLVLPLLAVGLMIYSLSRSTDLGPAERVRWKTAKLWSVVRSPSVYRYALWTFAMMNGVVAALYIPWVLAHYPWAGRPDFSSILWTIVDSACVGLAIGFVDNSLRVEQPVRVTPNEGTYRSARNAIMVGVLTGPPIGLAYGLNIYIASDEPHQYVLGTTFIYGSLAGFWIGSIIGLMRGGLFSIQHLFTRLTLWLSGKAPLRYVHFLNSAVDIVLLRRVGGGYAFIHRTLLEYFVALGTGERHQRRSEPDREPRNES